MSRSNSREIDPMSKHEHGEQNLPRRAFLRAGATLVGATGLGLAAATANARGPAAAAAPPAPEPERGYRESEHVRHYYRMADF